MFILELVAMTVLQWIPLQGYIWSAGVHMVLITDAEGLSLYVEHHRQWRL